MRKRYSFSSRRTGNIENMRKQKKKYPTIADKIVKDSDIILQILDARFPEETRNPELEEEILSKGKIIIYVFNKSDLVDKRKLRKFNYLNPSISISCTSYQNIKDLRDLIKRTAKKIKKPVDKDKLGRVAVGVIGYPNTGKSSLINILIGKSSAGVGSDAGFTKSIQKLKLSEEINLLDSPGVIPKKEYSSSDIEKIATHTKLGGRSYSQVKDAEMVVASLMKDYGKEIEKFYKIKAKGDSEILLEELCKQKGFFKSKGLIDEDKAARIVLKDWQQGKIRV
jgi:ribosome biogenesis GTPase A